MTPEECVAALDAALATAGEDIVLRRTTGTTNQSNTDVGCRAFVRGYTPQQLVGGITQQDSQVVLSPTEIIRAQWPGGVVAGTTSDTRVPRNGDKAVIAGRVRNVEAATGLYMNGELVRIEMRVLG